MVTCHAQLRFTHTLMPVAKMDTLVAAGVRRRESRSTVVCGPAKFSWTNRHTNMKSDGFRWRPERAAGDMVTAALAWYRAADAGFAKFHERRVFEMNTK